MTSHKKNLQYLAIEIYKTFNIVNPPFLDEVFSINECRYNFQKFKTAEPYYNINFDFVQGHIDMDKYGTKFQTK